MTDDPPPPHIPPPEFHPRLAEMGIELEAGDEANLGRYLSLLLEANRSFNLTAVREPAAAWMRHIADALALLPMLAGVEGAGAGGEVRVVDVGSGGGLPGIPLAITMPGVRFTLVEATGKKAEFLRRVAREMGLANVEVVQDRAERVGQSAAHRERYDAAVARAVGALAVLAELMLPLVRVGGVALAVKGAKAEEELKGAGKAIALLGGEHDRTVETGTGRVVVIMKVRGTPRAYPRRDGEPASKPLGIGGGGDEPE